MKKAASAGSRAANSKVAIMFLTQVQASKTIEAIIRGDLASKDSPAWAIALVEYVDRTSKSQLAVANSSVDSSKEVSVFGQKALAFKSQLSALVEESHMLATATEEMAATAGEIEHLGQSLLEKASASRAKTDEGKRQLDALLKHLNSVEETVTSVGKYVGGFVEKTQAIMSLTSTVNAIADQTNLLALNAAIEAARAGEHGRGFAVVADEVRGLASRSAEAASEIQDIVAKVVDGASQIDSTVKSAAQVLRESYQSRQDVEAALDAANETAEENENATTQIASAASQQSSVAADMAERVTKNADTTSHLSEIFSHISGVINNLRNNQSAVFLNLEASNANMTLAQAKNDHVIWVDKVIRYALYGDNSITSSELKDHTQCRLGKFLDSEAGQIYKAEPLFNELYKDIHVKVHKTGIALYEQASKHGRKREKELQNESEKLIQLSMQVLDILDTFIK